MKAVLTTKPVSIYDDDPSRRYHFPSTYLRQMERAVADFVVFYEPRRTSVDLASRGGLQSYYAVARLTHIEADGSKPDHFYGYLDNYVDFDTPVPFREGRDYFEAGLQKADGSTNKGAFGRSVRAIADEEFQTVVTLGFQETGFSEIEESGAGDAGFSEPPTIFERPLVETIVSRRFRDRAFSRQVQIAYQQRCAITGIRIINGGGRAEAQAAHIRPVAASGPDSVRNGLALSGTIHWMFDRGLLAIDDEYRILKATAHLPEGVERLFHPSGTILLPESERLRPHPEFLRYHRETVFKG